MARSPGAATLKRATEEEVAQGKVPRGSGPSNEQYIALLKDVIRATKVQRQAARHSRNYLCDSIQEHLNNGNCVTGYRCYDWVVAGSAKKGTALRKSDWDILFLFKRYGSEAQLELVRWETASGDPNPLSTPFLDALLAATRAVWRGRDHTPMLDAPAVCAENTTMKYDLIPAFPNIRVGDDSSYKDYVIPSSDGRTWVESPTGSDAKLLQETAASIPYFKDCIRVTKYVGETHNWDLSGVCLEHSAIMCVRRQAPEQGERMHTLVLMLLEHMKTVLARGELLHLLKGDNMLQNVPYQQRNKYGQDIHRILLQLDATKTSADLKAVLAGRRV